MSQKTHTLTLCCDQIEPSSSYIVAIICMMLKLMVISIKGGVVQMCLSTHSSYLYGGTLSLVLCSISPFFIQNTINERLWNVYEMLFTWIQ